MSADLPERHCRASLAHHPPHDWGGVSTIGGPYHCPGGDPSAAADADERVRQAEREAGRYLTPAEFMAAVGSDLPAKLRELTDRLGVDTRPGWLSCDQVHPEISFNHPGGHPASVPGGGVLRDAIAEALRPLLDDGLPDGDAGRLSEAATNAVLPVVHAHYAAQADHLAEHDHAETGALQRQLTEAQAAIAQVRDFADTLDEMGKNAARPDDRRLYQAIAADLRTKTDPPPAR